MFGVEFEVSSSGSLSVNGEMHSLTKIEAKTQSEHTLGGNQYALELQFVHENTDSSSTAVVSVLCNAGTSEADFLFDILEYSLYLTNTWAMDPTDLFSTLNTSKYLFVCVFFLYHCT